MKRRVMKSAGLLVVAVLGGACGSGEIGAGGSPYDLSDGPPRTAVAVDGGVASNGATQSDVDEQTLGAGDPSDRPSAHNTGPTDLGVLVPSGPVSLSAPGTYTDLDVTGGIYITSDDVTVRNFRVNADGGQRAIDIAPGHKRVVLEDGELYGMSSIAIYGLGYTARRLHIHDSGGDALRPEGAPGSGPTLVEFSFIEKMGLSANAHADGLQVSNVSDGSYDVTLQYNNIFMPSPGTPSHPGDTSKSNACIFIERPVTDFVIQNNWLNGGGYTVYCGSNSGDVIWRNNIFGGDYEYGIVTGTCQQWSNNVWEDTGDPIQ